MKAVELLEHIDYILSYKTSGIKRFLAFLWLVHFVVTGAWTAPNSVSANDAISAANHNLYIRDNLNYLLSGRQYGILASLAYVHGSGYTTTSVSFVDVDAANVILTLTPQSTRVRVMFTFTGNPSANSAQYDILQVGGSRAGDATNGLVTNIAIAVNVPICVFAIFTGLTPGVQVQYKLQHRIVTSGTSTIVATVQAIVGLAQEF